MIGIIILIVLMVRIYRTAKETGRNAVGWTIAAAGVYIGVQLVITGFLLLLLAVGVQLWGWRESVFTNFSLPIDFLSVILSLVGVWILANYVSSEPAENKNSFPPQPTAPPQV